MATGMKSFDYMLNDAPLFRVIIQNDKPIQQICFNEVYRIQQPLDNQLSVASLQRFFESRCFSEQRPDKHELLRMLGVPYFDAYLLCRKTHGIVVCQPTWLRFEDEPEMTFAQAKKDLADLVDRNCS